jgi:hypothetical protein
MAYTSDHTIRYYNFVTNVDAQIPLGPSSRDLLSDISGSKIVFSRVITGVKTAVMVFDAATPGTPPVEIDPVTPITRIGSAIGGDTVAYIDYGLNGFGEVIIHDLASAVSVRATIDVASDANPSVSPDGNVVTWEHCATSTSNCDIWKAVRNGVVWDVGVIADSGNPEANPDNNGILVVHDTVLITNNSELLWHSVNGGTPVQLQMPSFEANPSIANNFIAFESRPTLFDTTDIYVYDITTNLLYRMTDTPSVTEQLNDITVLPDGRIRVVWASDEDGFDQRNIKSATFSLGTPDVSPPTITPHANLTVNATMASGAVVSFMIQATDNVAVTSLVCVPASGSVFAIGISQVQCTANDAAGNSASTAFSVRVKDAPEQILELAVFVGNTPMPTLLKLRLLTALAIAFANRSNKAEACGALNAFIQMVQAQPPNAIPGARKARMIADAGRIKSVLGCP